MFDAKSFSEFIAPNADRRAFIQHRLLERGIETAEIRLHGRTHIYAKLPASGYNPSARTKTIIAHYDRFPESPGANDNSSAVFCLIDFAARLLDFKGAHNVRIFFTDGEELASGEGVEAQGAYWLAGVMQKSGIADEDVFVFDSVGRGTLPILGAMRRANPVLGKKCAALEHNAKMVLSSLGVGFRTLPIPYSDNAGFLARGIPAITFTMLPENEAREYIGALGKSEAGAAKNRADGTQNPAPKTWRLMHTADDNIDSLTPESFEIVARILDKIALI